MAIYSDFNISFEPNELSKDIEIVTDEIAVSQSVKSLILTSYYERPFQPSIGSNIRKLLFEPMNAITKKVLAQSIKEVIDQFEPRAVIKYVDIYTEYGPKNERLDSHTIIVDVGFYVLNTPSFVTTTVSLKRLR
jgi:hypothetical protein